MSRVRQFVREKLSESIKSGVAEFDEYLNSMSICRCCGEQLAIGSWPFCASRTNPGGHAPPTRHNAQTSDADAVVLYEHPTKGVRWPGRNDAPVPAHYAREGFQKVEYKRGLADVRQIEKRHGVVSEIGNYDRSGHAD